MAEKMYSAVLSVDENKLKEMEGGSFENALGWCLESGVTLVSCKELPSEATYSMVVHKSNGSIIEHKTVTHTWKDIIKVNGEIYAEEHPISGEKNGNGDEEYYQIDDFLSAVAKKHGVNADEIQTYMMDNIEFNPKELPFGAEDCGCYVNGIAEWLTDSKKEEKLSSYIVKSIEEECGEEYFTLFVPSTVSKEIVMRALRMATKYASVCAEYIDSDEAEDFDEFYEIVPLENGQETFKYYLEVCRGWKLEPLHVDFWYEW